MLQTNLHDIRRRIEQACQRVGRDALSVTLICVTKTVPVEVIRQALALGAADLGENRVQEARDKHEALGPEASSARWHLIGRLQRNKARDAVKLFQMIHSVDSVELAEALARQAQQQARTPQVLIEVNVSGEATKAGCTPDEARGLAQAISTMPSLKLAGLMTIAPLTDDPELARPHFRRLRELRDAMSPNLKLSMGMSQDFEIAIEEGADYVRVGSALFGAREGGAHA